MSCELDPIIRPTEMGEGEDGGAHVFNYLWAFNGPFNYFGDDKRMELITGSLDL